MTTLQIRKLDNIIAKLEVLQNEIVKDDPARDYLANAKSALIKALRKTEGM